MELIEEVKLLVGITDNTQDFLLDLIIQESNDRIISYINQCRIKPMESIPARLNYIVRDVSIKRFNRINSEGTTRHSEEGQTFEWDDYLAEYTKILNGYTDKSTVRIF